MNYPVHVNIDYLEVNSDDQIWDLYQEVKRAYSVAQNKRFRAMVDNVEREMKRRKIAYKIKRDKWKDNPIEYYI